MQPSVLPSLTPQETSILVALCDGLTNEEIASLHDLNITTVRSAVRGYRDQASRTEPSRSDESGFGLDSKGRARNRCGERGKRPDQHEVVRPGERRIRRGNYEE